MPACAVFWVFVCAAFFVRCLLRTGVVVPQQASAGARVDCEIHQTWKTSDLSTAPKGWEEAAYFVENDASTVQVHALVRQRSEKSYHRSLWVVPENFSQYPHAIKESTPRATLFCINTEGYTRILTLRR